MRTAGTFVKRRCKEKNKWQGCEERSCVYSSKTRSRSWTCTHDQTFRPTSILHVAILRVRWSRLRETAGCTRTNGMMSATASLGLSLLSDTDLGLSHVNKYTYSAEEYIKAGALLATVILNNGVRTEADVAKGLIGETSTTNALR